MTFEPHLIGDLSGSIGLEDTRRRPPPDTFDVRPFAQRALFSYDPVRWKFYCGPGRCYDVARDGQTFYTLQWASAPPAPVVSQILLIDGWAKRLDTSGGPGK